MTRPNIKGTRRFLIKALAVSIIIIGLVTLLYHWKGLENMESKTNPDESYYVTF